MGLNFQADPLTTRASEVKTCSLDNDQLTWLTYEELRKKDAKLHQVLCRIIKEMLRADPAKGTGKPEPLKHQLSGLWSRRLSSKDRVIYKFDDQYVYIFAIGGHYD